MTRSMITVAGAALTRDKAAPWNAPWSCAGCLEAGPAFDTDDKTLGAITAWAEQHARCATTKPTRSR